MLNRPGHFFAMMLVATVLAFPARAQTETPITIHVTAENGKPLSGIAGEAQITLRDKTSGDALASGQTYQGKFDVSIDLPRPTPATISVTGPLANISSTVDVSRDILLVPGKDYSAGGGIGITLPGMIVSLLAPAPDQTTMDNQNEDIIVSAYVAGLDGQPLAADTHEVDAVVYAGSVILGSTRMVPAGQPGRFATKLKFPSAGTYIIVVTAYDPASKSAAMDQGAFVVTESAGKPAETAPAKKK